LHCVLTSFYRRLGTCRQVDGAMNDLQRLLSRLKAPTTGENNAGHSVCQVATNICTSSVWNLLYFNLLASRVFSCVIDFWKTLDPIPAMKLSKKHIYRMTRARNERDTNLLCPLYKEMHGMLYV